MVSSDGVKITEPTDDQLRDIARKATGTGYYSGGVKALRAVWNAARAVERMPEDVQELVQELVTRLRKRARRLAARREVEGYKPDREDTIAEIEAAVAALEAAHPQTGADRG